MKNNNFSAPSTTQPLQTLLPTTLATEDRSTVDDVTTQLLQQQRVAAANSVLQSVPGQTWNIDNRISGNLEQQPQEFLAEMINAGFGDNIIDLIVSKINNMRDKIKGMSSCSNSEWQTAIVH